MSDFDDVGRFHNKFGLRKTGPREIPGPLTPEARDFRLKFLLEELNELAEGYGLDLTYELTPKVVRCPYCDGKDCEKCCNGSLLAEDLPGGLPQDLPKIADALVDLVYVALGTAHMHALPWQKLWDDVQRANMSKERCGIDHHFESDPDDPRCGYRHDKGYRCNQPKAKHSLRGNALDVIKPANWKGPDPHGVLTAYGWPGPSLPGMPAQAERIEMPREPVTEESTFREPSLFRED